MAIVVSPAGIAKRRALTLAGLHVLVEAERRRGLGYTDLETASHPEILAAVQAAGQAAGIPGFHCTETINYNPFAPGGLYNRECFAPGSDTPVSADLIFTNPEGIGVGIEIARANLNEMGASAGAGPAVLVPQLVNPNIATAAAAAQKAAPPPAPPGPPPTPPALPPAGNIPAANTGAGSGSQQKPDESQQITKGGNGFSFSSLADSFTSLPASTKWIAGGAAALAAVVLLWGGRNR